MLNNFLKTKRPKRELKTALNVLREFKSHEDAEVYLCDSFASWAKLDALESILERLTNTKRAPDVKTGTEDIW